METLLRVSLLLSALVSVTRCQNDITEQDFRDHKICPTVIKTCPMQNMNITYSNGQEVKHGNIIPANQTTQQPTLIEFIFNFDYDYTVLCFVINSQCPPGKATPLWMVTNIDDGIVTKGLTLLKYRGPKEMKEKQRVVFIAARLADGQLQTCPCGPTTSDLTSITSTCTDINKYMNDNGMVPESGNEFETPGWSSDIIISINL